jgi:hypothetical protein
MPVTGNFTIRRQSPFTIPNQIRFKSSKYHTPVTINDYNLRFNKHTANYQLSASPLPSDVGGYTIYDKFSLTGNHVGGNINNINEIKNTVGLGKSYINTVHQSTGEWIRISEINKTLRPPPPTSTHYYDKIKKTKRIISSNYYYPTITLTYPAPIIRITDKKILYGKIASDHRLMSTHKLTDLKKTNNLYVATLTARRVPLHFAGFYAALFGVLDPSSQSGDDSIVWKSILMEGIRAAEEASKTAEALKRGDWWAGLAEFGSPWQRGRIQ